MCKIVMCKMLQTVKLKNDRKLNIAIFKGNKIIKILFLKSSKVEY